MAQTAEATAGEATRQQPQHGRRRQRVAARLFRIENVKRAMRTLDKPKTPMRPYNILGKRAPRAAAQRDVDHKRNERQDAH